MSDEERDMAVVQGHLERAAMVEAALAYIDNKLLPEARAREAAANRSGRRKAKKKKGSRR